MDFHPKSIVNNILAIFKVSTWPYIIRRNAFHTNSTQNVSGKASSCTFPIIRFKYEYSSRHRLIISIKNDVGPRDPANL